MANVVSTPDHRGPWWLLGILFATWLIIFLIGSLVDSRIYSDPVHSVTLESPSNSVKGNESTITCQCSLDDRCACDQTIVRRFRTIVERGQHPPTESDLLCAPDRVTFDQPKSPKHSPTKDPLGDLIGWPLLQVMLSWTWTNLLILCALSALIGELAAPSRTECTRAMSRAFFIYLFTISGQLLFAGEIRFEIGGPANYFKLAILISILGFLVGYQPSFFIDAVDRFAGLTQTNGQPAPPANSVGVVTATAVTPAQPSVPRPVGETSGNDESEDELVAGAPKPEAKQTEGSDHK